MKLLLLLSIFSVLLSACDFDIPEPDAYLRLQRVFSASEAEAQNLGAYVDGAVAGYWTPQEFDTTMMNSVVIKYLVAAGEREILEDYDTYRHQHFGYIQDDQQYIYGNYFCDAFDLNWRETFLLVMDGGKCFFQVEYDAANAQVVNLYINGDA